MPGRRNLTLPVGVEAAAEEALTERRLVELFALRVVDDPLPEVFRLIRLNARSTDSFGEQPAREEGRVANGFRVESIA